MSDRRARLVLSCLLVASAALFAIGVAIERHDNRERTTAARPALSGLLLADAGGASEGAGGESGGESGHKSGEASAKSKSHSETSGESAAHRRAEKRGAPERGGETAAQHRAERSGERVFGIDIESTPLVVAAVAVSLILVALLWLTPSALVPLAIVGFALVAAVFDVREVFHQLDESRGGLATIAGVVAALHLGAAAIAVVLASPRARRRPQTQG